jgi:Acyl-CoA carboxylase epsilon subunit
MSGRSERTPNAVTDPGPTPQARRALFRVVRGEPSDAEVAALTVALAAAAEGAADARRTRATPPRDLWSDPAARLRAPLHPGPGAWRSCTWPR